MNISFQLDDQLAQHLSAQMGDLDRAAKESFAIEAYRHGRISLGKLAEILEMGVIEADRWLAEHGVPLNYTLEDFKQDMETLDRVLDRDASCL